MRLARQCSWGGVAIATVLSGLALIGVAATAMTGNGSSDSEQLIANEKAWAQAAVDGDAAKMASLMADEYVELVWEKEWIENVRRRTEVFTSVDLRNRHQQWQ